ncbi:type I glyceraldehyde-3-phosphate dehydrogenase [Alphaproteobacteria bacterium]|nr:type I glyceraldehyde-3-phosphate dehydrogenase [Alphaproteobacteria bacterium]GHS96344.1 type I glyceraldehyde-3-phosphate dehydrogenase [Alphaproteobacteria bacterium]
MALKVAINGFGRIGRVVLRAFYERNLFHFEGLPDLQGALEIVAINDLMPPETNAHLFKYDSVHGTFFSPLNLKLEPPKNLPPQCKGTLDIGQNPIALFQEAEPQRLPWKDLDIDLVFECSGRFTTREQAALHLEGGAKRVLISAPGTNADRTVVYGVNHTGIEEEHVVLSNASCTTNCLAPVAKILNDLVGIECGHMTTIHAYTSDQRLVDTAHKDLRRARAAAVSIIPTSTGAAKAVGLVLPALQGRLDGVALRVPTPNVGAVDLSFIAAKATNVRALNEALEAASHEEMRGVLGYCREPLVSIDFNHSALSATVDSLQTKVMDERLCRVFAWYDNEWGFSNRMLDIAVYLKNQKKKGFLKRK